MFSPRHLEVFFLPGWRVVFSPRICGGLFLSCMLRRFFSSDILGVFSLRIFEGFFARIFEDFFSLGKTRELFRLGCLGNSNLLSLSKDEF